MNYEALEKLVALKEKGILSEEEFQTEKKKLLNSTNEVSQNTTTQEETTSQIVEQNNYNANPILQEHKTKGSPEKTVLLVILIPIVIIGIMWLLNKKDSTPSYNYTPSSSYTSTTSTTTNTSSASNNGTTTSTNKSTSNSNAHSTSSADTSITSNVYNTDTRSESNLIGRNLNNNNTTKSNSNKEVLTTKEEYEMRIFGQAFELHAKKLWGQNKKQHGGILMSRTTRYFNSIKNQNADTVNNKYLGKYDLMELAQIYLFLKIAEENKINLEGGVDAKILKQISDKAWKISDEYRDVNEDVVVAFSIIAYGYRVLANEGKDPVEVFKEMYGEAEFETDGIKEIFKIFTESRDVTRSENIPNNDPGY